MLVVVSAAAWTGGTLQYSLNGIPPQPYGNGQFVTVVDGSSCAGYGPGCITVEFWSSNATAAGVYNLSVTGGASVSYCPVYVIAAGLSLLSFDLQQVYAGSFGADYLISSSGSNNPVHCFPGAGTTGNFQYDIAWPTSLCNDSGYFIHQIYTYNTQQPTPANYLINTSVFALDFFNVHSAAGYGHSLDNNLDNNFITPIGYWAAMWFGFFVPMANGVYNWTAQGVDNDVIIWMGPSADVFAPYNPFDVWETGSMILAATIGKAAMNAPTLTLTAGLYYPLKIQYINVGNPYSFKINYTGSARLVSLGYNGWTF